MMGFGEEIVIADENAMLPILFQDTTGLELFLVYSRFKKMNVGTETKLCT